MTTFTQRRATVEAFVDCMRGGADKGVSTVAADLTDKEVLSGETHHAAFFRLEIEDTAVNGMDYIILDADGQIAEVAIFRRPPPSAVEMQGRPCASRRHAALGTARQGGMTITGCHQCVSRTFLWDPIRHE